MKHTGPAPFGFTWQGDSLYLVENEAQVRRFAFELFLQLQSKAAVAERLNSLGHTTRRGSKWRAVTVGRLLVCPSARGLYALHKRSTNSAGVRVERPPEEWEFM